MLNPNYTHFGMDYLISHCQFLFIPAHNKQIDFVDFHVNMQCGLQIQYCPKPHVESQFDISLRLGTVSLFFQICCDMWALLHRNSFQSSVKTFAIVCCGITEIETESILQQSWNANEQRKS